MKFKLTSEFIVVYGITLFRIEATADFGDVEKGDKGGFIEKEANLSQDGEAWVYSEAQACGNARVFGNARVYGNAWISENARVFGEAQACGNAWISGNARVSGLFKIIS